VLAPQLWTPEYCAVRTEPAAFAARWPEPARNRLCAQLSC